MDLESRYQLLEKIGTGSYATVFRARDLELGREVAIREINPELMAHPEQLERYWQEAQLLASLQHPNIVTIFDIHREKGWVILELMQASLKDRTAGRQIELKSLRTTLAHTLRALKYLHSQGVVHGDIKPSNLMLDARRRIKLGDFGLARRASDADGELLKGTTKYMAPEAVSDDFGEFGPASDLYSLGFAAYELLCGENFDDLFPGLSAFGKNEQIAWMMWHAAPDRKLPEIPRVLEGVPPDLVKVIHKLTEKDQNKRYKTAEAALADLDIESNFASSRSGLTGEQYADGDASQPPSAPQDKKRLIGVIIAFSLSAIMSIAMLFMGGGGDKPSDNTITQRVGIVREVLNDENAVILLDAETGAADEMKLGNSPVIYFRNDDKNILLREIQPGDRVAVEPKETAGKSYLSLTVDRPAVTHGKLLARDSRTQRITIAIEAGTERGELSLRMPARARVRINANTRTLADLEEGDVVEVSHFPELGEKTGRVVDQLTALRPQELTGYIANVVAGPPTRLQISFGAGSSTSAPLDLPVGDECEIFMDTASERVAVPLENLKSGDRVKLVYDVAIRQIEVTREQTQASGIIQDVTSSRIVVKREQGQNLTLAIADDCEVTINLASASRDDLRPFDTVKVSYDDTAAPPMAAIIDAKRPVRYDRWAVIIANEAFDDRNLTPAKNAGRDARMFRQALLDRYAFDDSRILLLVDQPQDVVYSKLDALLKDVRKETQLIVYLAGNAYKVSSADYVMAAKDTHLDRLLETGIVLQRIARAVEASGSEDKMLFFDTAQEGSGRDLQNQPSSGEVLEWSKPIFKQTALFASCSSGETGLERSDGKNGVFASVLSLAFQGKADTDRDLHITPTELEQYFTSAFSQVVPEGKTQSPVIFIP